MRAPQCQPVKDAQGTMIGLEQRHHLFDDLMLPLRKQGLGLRKAEAA